MIKLAGAAMLTKECHSVGLCRGSEDNYDDSRAPELSSSYHPTIRLHPPKLPTLSCAFHGG